MTAAKIAQPATTVRGRRIAVAPTIAGTAAITTCSGRIPPAIPATKRAGAPCARIARAREKQRGSDDGGAKRGEVTQRRSAVVPDRRQKRGQDRAADRHAEFEAKLAQEKECRRKEEKRRNRHNGLQRAEFISNDEMGDLREQNEKRISRRMRMLCDDVVAAQTADEQRLVPIELRCGEGVPAADCHDHAKHGENGFLTARQWWWRIRELAKVVV